MVRFSHKKQWSSTLQCPVKKINQRVLHRVPSQEILRLSVAWQTLVIRVPENDSLTDTDRGRHLSKSYTTWDGAMMVTDWLKLVTHTSRNNQSVWVTIITVGWHTWELQSIKPRPRHHGSTWGLGWCLVLLPHLLQEIFALISFQQIVSWTVVHIFTQSQC